MGDVTGGPAFTHSSYDDYRILHANLIKHEKASTRDRIVPHAVFIDPQLGRVGMTEREARAQGRAIRVAKLPMSTVVRAIETGETRGFMKAIVDADNGQILGAAVLGSEGGEIMTIIQVAMLGKLTYTAMANAIFTHPLLAEGLNTLFALVERPASGCPRGQDGPAAACRTTVPVMHLGRRRAQRSCRPPLRPGQPRRRRENRPRSVGHLRAGTRLAQSASAVLAEQHLQPRLSRGNAGGRADPGPQRVLTRRGRDPPPVGERADVCARRQQPPRPDLADLGRSGLNTERTRRNSCLSLAAVRVEALAPM